LLRLEYNSRPVTTERSRGLPAGAPSTVTPAPCPPPVPGCSMAELPAYAPLFDAYHDAYELELRAMIDSVPIAPGDWVLDLAGGDGTYSRWLADRVGLRGGVLGVAVSHAYLEKGAEAIRAGPGDRRIRLVAADVDRLPFADNTFDAAWCAQSL